MSLYIGLMSGTSMDGIDAALIDLSTNTFIHGITRPYSEHAQHYLQEALEKTRQEAGYFSQLNSVLGAEFALAALQVLSESNYSPNDITAIGSHGQTLCHNTSAKIPYTVQSGCAHTIAEMTNITVVADFRTRDMVIGGQGAPFAPLYHQEIFKEQGYPLAIVNIGGIANITYLNNEKEVYGYDLGPGNCLMDAWILQHLGKHYDNCGEWAASGKPVNLLLEALLHDEYFHRSAPKSVGKEYFSLRWLNDHIIGGYKSEDIQATLLYLTALSIVNDIKTQNVPPEKLFICGGGAHNLALLNVLSQLLPEIKVQSSEVCNLNPDFIEAHMFAWLAEKALNRTPVDMTLITGARHPTILGAIYPSGIDKRI